MLARRTVKAMSLVVEHSKMTTLTFEGLLKCIKTAIEGKQEELQRNFTLLEEEEREADGLRRRIIQELARGELPTDERVGLMRLSRQIDWVIDWAHEAGRILVLFDFSNMPKPIQDVVLEMCSILSECTTHLVDCTQKLMDGSLEDTLSAADEVERLEERVDQLYQNARGNLKDVQNNRIPVGTIILLSQFIDAIENTADRCEDSCDQARVMAVTLSKRKD